MPNRLASEKSPYLIQHAENPVDWYPWGEEAFAHARATDRPIFLSIGYATCHWCHVMERESFENPAIAKLLKDSFVSIKVDREERPDVDRVYMAYVQATTGSGGWPMSVFLTPDLEPFFGGTYFPPDDRYGRPGFGSLLKQIANVWTTRRADVIGSAKSIVTEMHRSEESAPAEEVGEDTLKRAYMQLAQSFDRKYAGFGGPPKFPRPSVLNFVLRWFARDGSETAANMVLATLHMMARGGMNDQLGGGFHRYSVDGQWHVPHFEKMLYDQAQLVSSYVDGYLISREPYLADTARATCDYVLRDLALPEGVFASAEDADSLEPGADHKKEGAFYVWTGEQIDALLGDEASAFKTYYAVEPGGNAEDPHGELTGKNVLHVVSKEDGGHLAGARAKLLADRITRPRPLRDDKALVAWNGMMIGALARAAAVLGKPRYAQAAVAAATFIRDKMWDGTTLLRRFREGDAAIDGYLDDHASFAAGLCDLYEATFDFGWLRLAEAVTARAIALFHDEKDGAFFSTTGRDPSVLLRMKEDWDGAEPAGSSVMAGVILRLSELIRPDWRPLADETVKTFSSKLARVPQALPQMLCVLDGVSRSAPQIVVAGEAGDPRTQALLAVVHSRFLPGRTLLLADARTRAELGERLPWVAGMGEIDGKPAAYVCKDHTCDRPVTNPDALSTSLPAHRIG